MAGEKQGIGRKVQSALLTGVSYMLPFVIGGGVLIALGFLLGTYQVPSIEPHGSTFASMVFGLEKPLLVSWSLLLLPILHMALPINLQSQ